jgi:tripartite-type tricarboxylate transporter receptor subunit TctC
MRNRFGRATKFIPVLTAMVVAAAALPSWAQTYPSRPVQLVVGYAQGGTGDFIAHVLAERLTSALGQPVNVENRPGASGTAAAQSVARAAPDGYTLLVGQPGEVSINPLLAKDIGYDPEKDLQPVALAATSPLALVVQSTAPYSSINEMTAASLSAPRGLSFASPGPGTPGHVAVELLRGRTKSRFSHVPFEGGGPALDALMAGQVDLYFAVLPSAMPHVAGGKLKMLGVSSAKRSLAAPNVPTVAEQTGIRAFDLTNWVGVFAPRGTPADIVQRLNRDINQILGQPDVVQQLVRHGAEAAPMSVDQFADFLKAETARYKELLRDEFCAKFLYGGCPGYVFVTVP